LRPIACFPAVQFFSAVQVERARSAAIELRNKQLQAQLDMAGDNVSFTGLPAFSASDRSRRPSIAPSALAPVHLQVRAAARMNRVYFNFDVDRFKGWVWMAQEKV
jgi:hypothetical protein